MNLKEKIVAVYTYVSRYRTERKEQRKPRYSLTKVNIRRLGRESGCIFKEDSLASKKFIFWIAFPTKAPGAGKPNLLKSEV